MEQFLKFLGILLYRQVKICKFLSRTSFGMDRIHHLQDLFSTAKWVGGSSIVLGQEFLHLSNHLIVEKIIFQYSYSVFNKLAYSIFKLCLLVLMFFCDVKVSLEKHIFSLAQ